VRASIHTYRKLGVILLMQKRIADHNRRVARLNRYVVVVALLWLVTSFALLFLSSSDRDHAESPKEPASNALLQAHHHHPSQLLQKLILG
jgi:uncharacterized membrane protein SpoIIM required for sporulation